MGSERRRAGANNMSDHHARQLIDAFMYYCPMDVRGKLIAEIPAAYNSYCGYEVVKVKHEDGRVARLPEQMEDKS